MSDNNTSCKACVFAEYEDLTQTGCNRGMIDKYRDAEVKILEAYDEDREFYVISNRLCPYYRTKAWANRIGEEDFDVISERMLKFETQLSFHVMVFMQDDLDALTQTIVSLAEQKMHPMQVTVIRPRTSLVEPGVVTDMLNQDENTPFKWRLENLWTDVPDRMAIHMVQKVAKTQYYVVAHAGHEFDKDFFSSINAAVIENILQFAMIEPEGGGDGTVIPLPVHEYWHFQGDVNVTIPENIFIAATNPDDPSHEAYKFFIKGSKKKGNYAGKTDEDGLTNIHTYYSLTEQNPFLPDWYHASLRKKYDAKMIRRMLYGEWLYISTDVIYYCYEPVKHFVPNLKIDNNLPLRLSFDFNIAKGKPMSSCILQFNPKASNRVIQDRRFKFFDEVAIEGAKTLNAMDEWQGKGWFDLKHNPKIIVHGDQTGSKSDSRGVKSDYDIIEKYLANYVRKDGEPLEYDIELPSVNPPVRERHNITNGQLENSEGEVAIAIDDSCYFIDAGFSNTRLAEKAKYTEDQTTEGQDMSTAATYAIHYCVEYGMIDDEDIMFM